MRSTLHVLLLLALLPLSALGVYRLWEYRQMHRDPDFWRELMCRISPEEIALERARKPGEDPLYYVASVLKNRGWDPAARHGSGRVWPDAVIPRHETRRDKTLFPGRPVVKAKRR